MSDDSKNTEDTLPRYSTKIPSARITTVEQAIIDENLEMFLFGEHTSKISYGCPKTLFKDGRVETGKYVNGKRQGDWFTLSSKGTLVSKIPYNNGVKHGVALYYDKQENVCSIQCFKNDLPIDEAGSPYRELFVSVGSAYNNESKLPELGLYEVVDREKLTAEYHTYWKPELELSEEDWIELGLTPDFLDDKPKFEEIAWIVSKYFEQATEIIVSDITEFKRLSQLAVQLQDAGYPKLNMSKVTHARDSVYFQKYRHFCKKRNLNALQRAKYLFDLYLRMSGIYELELQIVSEKS